MQNDRELRSFKKTVKRVLKFIFIAVPFVVIYLLAIIFFIVSIITPEVGSLFEKVIAGTVSILSVLIVTWGAGFWGRWKFPILFALLPVIIFIDMIVSQVIGIKPMLLTVLLVIIGSVIITIKETTHNNSRQPTEKAAVD